ncbi:MAG: hypothetical protein WDZ54_00690 [Sneathiella sp.]
MSNPNTNPQKDNALKSGNEAENMQPKDRENVERKQREERENQAQKNQNK